MSTMMMSKSLNVVSAAHPMQRQSVRCRASLEKDITARRSVLFSAPAAGVALFNARPAFALIPDEADEAFIKKARENRQQRLIEERKTTQTFIQSEGLKNVELDQALIPVQRGIFTLAEVGKKLQAGDIQAVAQSVGSGWTDEFVQAITKVPEGERVVGKVDGFKQAVGTGDLASSKSSYVELVGSIESWAEDANVKSVLQGL